ncbi:MAG: hypothetical protein IT377_01730 [Polyangiaceae bacterium]|nr:hypothetical protein [Polyangiaceae bacterium]
MKTATPFLWAALLALGCESKPADPAPPPSATASAPLVVPSASAGPSASGAPSAEPPASDAATAADGGDRGDGGDAPASDAGAAKKAFAPEHGVKLLEPGAEPRQKLRYKFVVDRTDRLEMTTTSSMKMAMGGQAADVPSPPAVRVVAALTVKEVTADGTAKRSLVLEDVGLMPGPGLSKEQRDQAEKNLSALEKLTGRDRVDSRGFVRQVELDASKIDNPALKQALAAMQQTFDQMGAPFPEEEIGVGAKWQVKTKLEQMGIKLTQTANYELSALTGDTGKIKLQLQQTAPGGNMELPGLPAGATAKLVGMKGSGKGELEFDLARSIPKGRIDTKSEVKVQVSMASDKQEMSTKMEAKVVFKPLTK